MEKILVSSCLLGAKVRYNAEGKLIHDPRIAKWFNEGRLVLICPEVTGGLPTPRPPAEIKVNKVFSKDGVDVTAMFQKGAEAALKLCKQNNIKIALLKARSPSCGNVKIYDGSFTGKTVTGQGVTAHLLTENDIQVFNENQLNELASALKAIEL